MNKRGRDYAVLDGCVQVFLFPSSDATNKVLEMITAALPVQAGLLIASGASLIGASVFVAGGEMTV